MAWIKLYSDSWDNLPIWTHVGYPESHTSYIVRGHHPFYQIDISLDGAFWDTPENQYISYLCRRCESGQSGGPSLDTGKEISGRKIVAIASSGDNSANYSAGGKKHDRYN